MRSRTPYLLLLAVGAVGVAGDMLLPEPGRAIAYDLPAVVAAVLCAAAGIRQPGARSGWFLLAAGDAMFVVGDVVYAFDGAFPGPADVAYLVAYPLLALGLALLVPRSRAGLVAALLDAALLTAAVGLFVFVFWLEPLAEQSGSVLTGFVSCGYPVADLLLVGLVTVAALRDLRRHALVIASLAALLVSDLVYSGMALHGTYSSGDVLDAGWIGSYTLLALGALRARRSAPAAARDGSLGWQRLVLPGACLFAVPLAELAQELDGGTVDRGDLALWAALIGLLVCARMALVARERRRVEEHFQALIETVNDVVVISDPSGDVRYTSPAVERVLGRTPAEMVGTGAFDFVHPDDRQALADGIEHALHDRPDAAIFRLQAADGSWRVLSGSGRVLDRGPHAGALLASLRDVTAQVEMERELADKEAQLRQSQKLEAIGQLAGGVAHDFNNLLTAISGYGGLVLERLRAAGDERDVDDLEQVLDSAARAAELTRQLLAFSRRQTLLPRPVELNETLRNLERMLRRLIGEHIELVCTYAREPAWVLVDPSQLEQVAINLAVNARDAMPGGGRLGIAIGGTAAFATLTVADTGCGMDAETREHAFEPFFTTKDVGRGTGLGLATVHGIVTQSHGDVGLDSAPGAGTTVTVRLPRIPAPAAHPEPAASGGDDCARLTVLLVEDEPIVRAVTGQLLEQSGCRVVAAANGPEALAALAREPVDLLVTDLVMPQMSGGRLAAEARRLQPRLPVLFTSGYGAGTLADQAEIEGAAFLTKPFGADELQAALRQALAALPAAAAA